MAKRYARQPGTDQIADWKRAIADRRRQQRRDRWKRKDQVTGVRVPPPPAESGPPRDRTRDDGR